MILGPVAAAVGSITKELNKQMQKLMALKAILDAAIALFLGKLQSLQAMITALERAGFYCIRLAPGRGSWNSRLRYAPGAPPDDPNGFSCGVCVMILDPSIANLISTYESFMKSLYGFKDIQIKPKRIKNRSRVKIPRPKQDAMATNIWMHATLKDLMPGMFATSSDVISYMSEIGQNMLLASAQADAAMRNTAGAMNGVNDFMADLMGAGAYAIMLPPVKGGIFQRLESETGHPSMSNAYHTCGFCAVAYAPTIWELTDKYAALQQIFEPHLEYGINTPRTDPNGNIDLSLPPLNPPIETHIGIGVDPSGAEIVAGATVQFTSLVTLQGVTTPTDPNDPATYMPLDIDQTVFWGCKGQGSVDATGLFTSPPLSEFLPNQPPTVVYAYPLADLFKSARAEVLIKAPEQTEISIFINPSYAQLIVGAQLHFTCIIYGTGNQNAIWSVEAQNPGSERLNGTIDAVTGMYQAPSVPVQTKIFARSVEDPTKIAECVVVVQAPLDGPDVPIPGDPDVPIPDLGSNADIRIWIPPPPPPPPITHLTVHVGITPTFGSVLIGHTMQFTANLINESVVTWTCVGVGNIDANTGLYTAPALASQPVVLGGGADSYVVPDIITATSVSDPTKFATALVYVIKKLSANQDIPIPGNTDTPLADGAPTIEPQDTEA